MSALTATQVDTAMAGAGMNFSCVVQKVLSSVKHRIYKLLVLVGGVVETLAISHCNLLCAGKLVAQATICLPTPSIVTL